MAHCRLQIWNANRRNPTAKNSPLTSHDPLLCACFLTDSNQRYCFSKNAEGNCRVGGFIITGVNSHMNGIIQFIVKAAYKKRICLVILAPPVDRNRMPTPSFRGIHFGGERKKDIFPTMFFFKHIFSQDGWQRGYVLLHGFQRIVSLCNSHQRILALKINFWRPLT